MTETKYMEASQSGGSCATHSTTSGEHRAPFFSRRSGGSLPASDLLKESI